MSLLICSELDSGELDFGIQLICSAFFLRIRNCSELGLTSGWDLSFGLDFR